jgi:hypothetical protein
MYVELLSQIQKTIITQFSTFSRLNIQFFPWQHVHPTNSHIELNKKPIEYSIECMFTATGTTSAEQLHSYINRNYIKTQTQTKLSQVLVLFTCKNGVNDATQRNVYAPM